MINRARAIGAPTAIVICLIGLAACSPASGQDIVPPQPNRSPAVQNSTPLPTSTLKPTSTVGEVIPKSLEPGPQIPLPGGLKRVQRTQVDPARGEVPEELIDEIITDLAQHLGVERSAVEVIRGEAVIWNDGSLGCPQPGMMYTQALVNGYWVILLAGEQEYDYRATDSGYFIRCDGSRLPPVGRPGKPGT